jgi:hypothetical protein
VAEGGGLLNRYRVVKPYRGFESLRLRHLRPNPEQIALFLNLTHTGADRQRSLAATALLSDADQQIRKLRMLAWIFALIASAAVIYGALHFGLRWLFPCESK